MADMTIDMAGLSAKHTEIDLERTPTPNRLDGRYTARLSVLVFGFRLVSHGLAWCHRDRIEPGLARVGGIDPDGAAIRLTA